MRPLLNTAALVVLVAVQAQLSILSSQVPAVSPNGSAAGITRLEILRAEDARAATGEQLRVLTDAATTAPAPLQAMAVRALGRLERPDLVPAIRPLLEAPVPAVRAEAANALAQAAGKDPGAVLAVRERLLARLVDEPDAEVTGAIAEALGRLPVDSPAIAQATETALRDVASRFEVTRRLERGAAGGRIVGLTLTPTRQVAVPLPALLGALRGLESFARGRARVKQGLQPQTIDRLETLALARPPASDARAPGARGQPPNEQSGAARVRRLALLCLLPVNALDSSVAARAMADPDAQVRRLAVMSASASRATLEQGMKDPSWLVRYEALLRFGRRFQSTEGCEPIVSRIGADTDHVSLLAIDLLASPCRPEDQAVESLLDLAASGITAAWHRPAHAMVALAQAAPERARPMLARFLGAGVWQSRMYAARAAGHLGEVAALRRLAADANDNVREAAIAGLSKVVKHEADPIYVAALGASDFQVVMTSAGALAGTPDRASAVPALLSALARLTALDADPSRDPRIAVLERLQELGSPDNAAALRPYLADADHRVAGLVARILTDWTGSPVAAASRPRPVQEISVTEAEIDRLSRSTVRVTMAGGRSFEAKLLADLAPMSCLRIAALVGRGYYNGLTFHRVIPNFLIQGGSPGANEFAGDRRYIRDEPGRPSQGRGTIGMSTRGRDTGDAQFYINLVDSPRLDHDYSIFAEVTRGMEVADAILEGDVMEKVELLPGRKGR